MRGAPALAWRRAQRAEMGAPGHALPGPGSWPPSAPPPQDLAAPGVPSLPLVPDLTQEEPLPQSPNTIVQS